jgi:glycosyltransferase involved in cell wall biosynthesis
MKKKLVIINNEKCVKKENNFYCENIEIKSITNLLNRTFNIKLILRKSDVSPIHKIENSEVIASSNIFIFLKNIIKSVMSKDSKYLIISVTPYTFFSFLIFLIFNKKIFLYLRSNGKEEISLIFGKKFSLLYKIVENIMVKFCNLIVVNNLISKKKKFYLVNPSQIDQQWFQNTKIPKRDKIKLLYVGRIKVEKGVYSLIDIFKKIKYSEKDLSLTLIGQGNKPKEASNKIKFLEPISTKKNLIEQYDQHDIFILPSYTEGHPQVLIESLVRQRPVVVFEEIEHVLQKYEGIFICKRDHNHFLNLIKFIDKNYEEILEKMKKNKYPTKEKFFKQLNKILN